MAAHTAAGEPTLGIIGGAGVGAAARLYIEVSALVRRASGRLPRIAIWNLPLSDEIEHAFTAAAPDPRMRELVDGMIGEAFERLLGARATVVAMPCNSLQRAAAAEAEHRGVAFIDMIEATVGAARASGAREAVLIATDATHASGVYERRGLEIVAPPSALHDETGALIERAVAAGPPPSGEEIASLVARAGGGHASVVLGCTDICGLVEPSQVSSLRLVESLGCLAERCADALVGPASSPSRGQRSPERD